MNFHVLTLFPEYIESATDASILGRAKRDGKITVQTVNIRDYAEEKRKNRVDDYPYGGGAGMVMEPEPVYQAITETQQRIGKPTRVVYLTPQAEVLTQTKVERLAGEEDLILLCGHYEGIDDRVLNELVTDYVSIGDYVLTGGELGALVMIDAISRFVPGVLNNDDSTEFESFQENLLEYPHYTRPEEWRGHRVPDVLLSGDHVKIEQWRHEQALLRTSERRPDLLRRIHAVTVIFVGDEAAAEAAKQLGNRVSHYAEYMDYNRRKLQKRQCRVTSDTLALFVVPEKWPEGIDPKEAFRNLTGKGTAAILCVVSNETVEAEGDEARTAPIESVAIESVAIESVAIDSVAVESVAKEKSVGQLLAQHGFTLQGHYDIPENTSVDRLADIALNIRSLLEKNVDTKDKV